MLRIYGYPASINVRKVLWTCAELGLPWEIEEWGLPHRPTSDPSFRALNPVGLVPVIDDAGTVISESNVIVRYLAASRGRGDLLPTDLVMRARVEMWMDWQASDFNNSWRIAFQGLVRKNPAHMDPAPIARSLAEFSRLVGIVDEKLASTGAFICGPDFTVADIAIGLSVHRWRSLPVEKPRLTNVEGYYDRLCARAGFRNYGKDGGA